MKNLSRALIALGICLIVTAAAINVKSQKSNDNTIILNTKNTITLRTDVNSNSMQRLQNEIVRLDSLRGNSDYPIFIVLDTPGGSIYAGNNFIDFLKGYKNIHTITLFAASMGAVIVESNQGKRYITDSGILMFHRASGSFEGQFEDGELESQLNFWKSIVRSMEETVSKRLGLSLKDYKDKVKDEYWTKGENAVKENAADEVVTVKCSTALIELEEVLEMDLGISLLPGLSIPVTFSACPLFREPLKIGEQDENK